MKGRSSHEGFREALTTGRGQQLDRMAAFCLNEQGAPPCRSLLFQVVLGPISAGGQAPPVRTPCGPRPLSSAVVLKGRFMGSSVPGSHEALPCSKPSLMHTYILKKKRERKAILFHCQTIHFKYPFYYSICIVILIIDLVGSSNEAGEYKVSNKVNCCL